MRQVRDLIGAQRAAAAGMIGPSEHSGLKERTIEDQLPAALEKVDEGNLTVRALELILLLHQHPRHPPTLGGQRITRAGESFFLHEHLLVRSLPLLRRHDGWCLHRDIRFHILISFLFSWHDILSLYFMKCFLQQSETIRPEKLPELG